MARKRDNDDDDTPWERPPLTEDELRELLLSLTVEGGNTTENRTRVYTELIHSGIREREAQIILNNPNEVMRSLGRGGEGTPPAPAEDDGEERLTGFPFGAGLQYFLDKTGMDRTPELAMRRGPVGLRSSSKRVTGSDDDDFTPEELVRGLDDPADVNQYIWANSPNWTIEEAEGVRDFLEENGGATGQYAGSYNQLFLDHDDLVAGSFDGEPVDRDGDAPPQSEASSGVDLSGLSGASPAEAREWLLENGDRLTDAELEEVEAHFTTLQSSGSAEAPAWAELVVSAQALREDTATNAGETPAGTQAQAEVDADEAEAVEEAVDKAAEIWGRSRPGVKPDFSSVEAMLPDDVALETVLDQGYDRALDKAASEEQSASGSDPDEARVIAEGGMAARDIFEATEPEWLLQANGGYLSEQQKRRYVEYWNDAYGTFIRDFDELAPILARFDGTEDEAVNMAKAVFSAQEPLISHAITLPLVQGERKVSYTPEELEDLRSMGFSNDAITRLVRLSAITAGESAIRPGEVGDTLRVGPLAMLVRYFGGGDEFARQTQVQQDQADLERQLGLKPGDWNRMTMDQRKAFRRRFEGTRNVSGITVKDPRVDIIDRLENMGRGSGLREEKGPMPGILAANNNFRRGLEMYRGDEFLSLIHAVDPGLAQRVASTPTADDLDWRDNAAVYDILEQAGAIESSNTRLRQLEDARGFFGYFAQGGGRGGGGGAGKVRRLVDPVAVKEQVQQLWSRMFLADVDDATVAAITANLQSQLDNAAEGMSFDVSARIMAFLKGQDVYDELYRNKPEGLSEEEYQAQMAAGVSDMLGNELDPEALKAGLRTGEYQTAVGRAAQSSALLDNSTLRGRWAQAKQTLDKFS